MGSTPYVMVKADALDTLVANVFQAAGCDGAESQRIKRLGIDHNGRGAAHEGVLRK